MVDNKPIVKVPYMDVHDFMFTVVTYLPGCYRSGGALAYVAAGKEIPDYLLPGRAMMKLKENIPGGYEKVVSADWQHVSPWWIKIMCGK